MITLCQRGDVGCGACCGLYNRDDLSRAAVNEELWRRTRALSLSTRTREGFRAAAESLARQGPTPLFPSVRHCPLLGFLDADGRRVGCLAHPMATGGVDLRECGAYDVATCSAFLCPSHARLGEEEAALAARAAGDSYLYGLVVTDAPFLEAVLEGLAALVGARVEPRHLEQAPFRAALRQLLALKEELAPGSEGHFGAFRHVASGESPPPGGDATARAPSAYDAILACVGADPGSGNDADVFEAEVRRRLDRCAEAFPGRGGRTADGSQGRADQAWRG